MPTNRRQSTRSTAWNITICAAFGDSLLLDIHTSTRQCHLQMCSKGDSLITSEDLHLRFQNHFPNMSEHPDQASNDDRQRERQADAVETNTDYMDATEFSIWEYIRDETGCSLEKLQISEIIRIAQRIPVSDQDIWKASVLKLSAENTEQQCELAAVTAERNKYRDDIAAISRTMHDKVTEQQREIARLKEECERWKTERAGALHSSECWELLHAKTHEERDKARAALREYGAHADNCATNAMSIRGTPCTCGFAAALEEAK